MNTHKKAAQQIISDQPQVKNMRVHSAEKAFEAVPKTAKSTVYDSSKFVPSDIVSPHFQGIARYKNSATGIDYYILTYNTLPHTLYPKTGVLVIVSTETDAVTQVIGVPIGDDGKELHPGGIQVIGDYLFVANESYEFDESSILVYNLFEMTDNNAPTYVKALTFDRGSVGTGAIGITTVGSDDHYIIALYDNGKLDFYTAPNDYLTNSNNALTPVFSTEIDHSDFSSIQLLTDGSDNVRLMGFRNTKSSGDGDDYMYLYKVHISEGKVKSEDKRHMHINDALTVSFRWCAGIRIHGDNTPKIEVVAGQRNPVTGGFKIAVFYAGG